MTNVYEFYFAYDNTTATIFIDNNGIKNFKDYNEVHKQLIKLNQCILAMKNDDTIFCTFYKNIELNRTYKNMNGYIALIKIEQQLAKFGQLVG